MLHYTGNQKILLAIEPVDFRKGAQSLVGLCREQLRLSTDICTWFVFTNRRRTAVKILSFDETGCWLATKYFARGKLAFWPTSYEQVSLLSADELELIVNQRHPIAANYLNSFGQSSSSHLGV
jgi:transposase